MEEIKQTYNGFTSLKPYLNIYDESALVNIDSRLAFMALQVFL